MKRSFFNRGFVKTLMRSLALAFLVCVSSQVAFAQEEASAGITIRPGIFEDRVDPGDVYTSSVRVTNETDIQQTYYISVNDVVDITDGGTPIFAKVGEAAILGIAEWMTVPTEPIVVEAHQTVEIPFTVTVPDNASPGNHIGGIFIGPEAQRPDVIGTGVGYQIVPIVNLQISGDLIEEAEIRSFVTEKLFYGKPEVTFTITIENKGNAAIRPRGPIEVKNMFGKVVGSVTVNDKAALVPPYTKRVYEVQWAGEEEIFFGRFVANATIAYGEQLGVKSMLRSVSFWILPMNVIIPGVVILLALVFGIYATVKIYIRKHLRAIERATGKTLKSLPKQQSSISRLSFIAVFLLVFSIIFLMILFIFFA